MKVNIVPYLGIAILLLIVLLQNRSCKAPEKPKDRIDTVIKYIPVHDTIKGDAQLIFTKIDTSIWMKKTNNVPSKNPDTLKQQYLNLGNKYFSTNFFSTPFKTKYGIITIVDSVRENSIIYNKLITDLVIPDTVITKTIPSPKKAQLFLGTTFTGNVPSLLKSVSVGALLKTKKDRIYGVGIGYDGEIIYSGSLYWPLKFK